MEDILVVAADDSEPWVQMLSELMKTYPSSGEDPKMLHSLTKFVRGFTKSSFQEL